MNNKRIILDISANTHGNNLGYCKKMIKGCIDIKKKLPDYEIIIKHQLFKKAGKNAVLSHSIFDKAFYFAAENGIKTTASIFDVESFEFLMQYDVPFIKIANNRSLDDLINLITRGMPVYISLGNIEDTKKYQHLNNATKLLCVSKYPAEQNDYYTNFGGQDNFDKYFENDYGLSDHTQGFDLYNSCNPDIVEWHLKLADSTGLDAGPFAKTSDEIINNFKENF